MSMRYTMIQGELVAYGWNEDEPTVRLDHSQPKKSHANTLAKQETARRGYLRKMQRRREAKLGVSL